MRRALDDCALVSEIWAANCGWVLTASLAACMTTWCRLLGLRDRDLKIAEPGMLRARLACYVRVLKISRICRRKEAFLACWQWLRACPHPPDQPPRPCDLREATRHSRSRWRPDKPAASPLPGNENQVPLSKIGTSRSVTYVISPLNR